MTDEETPDHHWRISNRDGGNMLVHISGLALKFKDGEMDYAKGKIVGALHILSWGNTTYFPNTRRIGDG